MSSVYDHNCSHARLKLSLLLYKLYCPMIRSMPLTVSLQKRPLALVCSTKNIGVHLIDDKFSEFKNRCRVYYHFTLFE